MKYTKTNATIQTIINQTDMFNSGVSVCQKVSGACILASIGDAHQHGATYGRRAVDDDTCGDGDPPSVASCSALMSRDLWTTSTDPLSCPTAVRRISLTAPTCLCKTTSVKWSILRVSDILAGDPPKTSLGQCWRSTFVDGRPICNAMRCTSSSRSTSFTRGWWRVEPLGVSIHNLYPR